MGYVTESCADNASGSIGESNKIRKQTTSGKPFELWLPEKKTISLATHDGENNGKEDKNALKVIPLK